MKKRLLTILMVVVLLLSNSSNVMACDEDQTNTYVTQILFGDRADSRASDEKVKMLIAALYLCSEQSDNQGQDKISYLKSHKVSGVPALKDINIKNSELNECSHNYWAYEFPASKKIRANRKKVLRNTVNKVFDFGFFNNCFNSDKGKCDSFAALLYYSHILADYLADDPSDTGVVVNGKLIPPYSGDPYTEINGNRPNFSSSDISRAESNTYLYDGLDERGRAGTILAVVGPNTLEEASRADISGIYPSGWRDNKYEGISGSQPNNLYNRSHLLARSMGGENNEENLVTGTTYMNQTGMRSFEDKVLDYVKRTGNHVLYRVTPIFKGDNKVCSGVQMEAYSIEDSGQGVSFNVYCYNVQPGIGINYMTGDNWRSDNITGAKHVIPFAVNNPSEDNPDLIFEMNKQFEVLFVDQKNTGVYISMMNDINIVANKARMIANSGENAANIYIQTKECQYEYFEVLKNYVPKLLEKEDFFSKAFK